MAPHRNQFESHCRPPSYMAPTRPQQLQMVLPQGREARTATEQCQRKLRQEAFKL